MKRALITGICGQDGSYLAELLLKEDYEVHGIVRRSSSINTSRIDHLYKDPHEKDGRFFLHYGDMLDGRSLHWIVDAVQPDEVYNLAAQSHVRVSFELPEYTCDVVALGTLRLLEAVCTYRANPDSAAGAAVKFYQASSSEIFGNSPAPQNEYSTIDPQSPYAAAKAFAYHLVKNYRDSHGLFTVNGILFNHECLSSQTPLIVRQGGIVDVVTPDELVPLRRSKGKNSQTFDLIDTEIWDGNDWTPLRAVTATRLRDEPDHQILAVQARGGVVEVTAHHRMIDAENETLPARALAPGSRVALAGAFPEAPAWTSVHPDLAEFLGHMVAEGYIPRDENERCTLQYSNNDESLRQRVADLWFMLFLGTSRTAFAPSGYRPENSVGQLYLNGGGLVRRWLRDQLYAKDGRQRIPKLILNADLTTQKIFCDAYYTGDGLKAGSGDSFKTWSPLLAQGLCWLYNQQGRQTTVYLERREEKKYYSVNLGSQAARADHHLRKDPHEVRRVDRILPEDEWVFDIETGTGLLCAGVGRVVVHNSERRGETFVTRKITRAVGRIHYGLQTKLYLGDLEARRDWGHAEDYVRAMVLAMQHPTPGDYVVGTRESHSVKEFLERAFALIGRDWHDHVEIDARYYRPTEVNHLLADTSLVREKLGWKPTIDFDTLVKRMARHDALLARAEKAAIGLVPLDFGLPEALMEPSDG